MFKTIEINKDNKQKKTEQNHRIEALIKEAIFFDNSFFPIGFFLDELDKNQDDSKTNLRAEDEERKPYSPCR